MSLTLGLAIQQGLDGKKYIIMTAMHEAGQHMMTIADENTYEQNVATIIQGLNDVKAEMRKVKSGLVLVQEVPDGLRPSQGRQQPRSRRKG